jgi:2-polyprenyl-6-methoxyphenol hydroxylase-like FAD-dependent oxidoreductase
MERSDVPVLIVGAGPTGVMLALLLRRLGVASRIVERRDGPQRAPAAHVVNARTFEICRQAGVDMAAIAAVARPPSDAGATYWVTARRRGARPAAVRAPGRRRPRRHADAAARPLAAPLQADPAGRCALPAATRRAGQRWASAEVDAGGVTSTVVDDVSRQSSVVRAAT